METKSRKEMEPEYAWIYPIGLIAALTSIAIGIFFVAEANAWLSGDALYTGPWDYATHPDSPAPEYFIPGLQVGAVLIAGGAQLLAGGLAQLYFRSRGHRQAGSPYVIALLSILVLLMVVGLCGGWMWWYWMYTD